MSKKIITQTSKQMSYLLRHGATKEGLAINDNGYVLICDLHKHINDKNVTLDVINDVVLTSDKKRFEISSDGLYIRAAQGHSMSSIKTDGLMKKLTLDDKYDECYHGTDKKAAQIILKMGLSKMARNHIHFAIGMPDDDNVVSSMRNNSNAIIVLDLKAAMLDGIEFYISSNNVILTEGIDGIISPKYFKKVIC